jgi:CheY-like chemotaxis protein
LTNHPRICYTCTIASPGYPFHSSANEVGDMTTPQPPGPLCVLAVDDNPDAADSLGLMLALWGHRPLVAYESAAALSVALHERPDVVLLDIGLRGMDGWQLARRLRAEPRLGGIVLIAVTGHGRADDHERSRQAGIDHHLLKPVEPDLLQRLLAAYQAGRLGRNGQR